VLAESLDQPHLIEAMDAVMRRHGGTPRVWRTDRLATVIVPGSRDVQPSFAPVAKHYGVVVEPCPPRRGNRKGAVESSVRYVCGRWWRTMTAVTPAQAQASLDAFCSGTADARRRKADGIASTVGALADAEPLLALPSVSDFRCEGLSGFLSCPFLGEPALHAAVCPYSVICRSCLPC
jgi:hypothetical protein